MENTEIQNEAVEQEVIETTAVEENEIKLESDKAEEEANEPTLDDLQEKLKQQEEYIKKLKDEKSQTKEQEIKVEKQQEEVQVKQEFLSNTLEQALNDGAISDEAFAKAEEMGMSKAELELQFYKQKESVNSIYEMAGGKETYFNMVDTVKEGVSEAEAKRFKTLLGNPETADIALMALKQKYQEVSGNVPEVQDRRIVTQTSTSGKSSAYKSMSEYQADMRYMRKLPSSQQSSYHAKISEKLNRSNLV